MASIRIELGLSTETNSADVTYLAKVSCPEAGWELPVRRLRRGTTWGYPLPPTCEASEWAGTAHEALCSADDDKPHRTLHNSIREGDPGESDVTLYGGYLFATLLGPAWKEVNKKCPAPGRDIEILTDPDVRVLDALPWEMMSVGVIPLIAIAGHSISRVVSDTPRQQAEIVRPLRVLFVVGEMDDALRPGAEYLAILRSLHSGGDGAAGKAGIALHVQSITDADASQIEDAVEAFKPQIVHIVAHGMMEGPDAVIRLTVRQGTKITGYENCSAARLLEIFTGRGKRSPPPLAVVNACHTSEESNPGDARAFAADLVRGGVVAAVGMSGEVASTACRLFTKAFYRTLAELPADAEGGGAVTSHPVQQAVAQGQFAARLHFEKYKNSVEWARPALFIARDAQVGLTDDARRIALFTAAANSRGAAELMCDRYGAVRAYETFMAQRSNPGSRWFLVFEQPSAGEEKREAGWNLPYQLGKTRLLEEIAQRALLDEYLPCLMPSRANQRPPNNLLLFALRLAECMDDLRVKFDIRRREVSAAQKLAFEVSGQSVALLPDGEDRDSFDQALEKSKALLAKRTGIGSDQTDVDRVAKAIARDLAELLNQVRIKCPCIRGALILLDDLDLCAGYHNHLLAIMEKLKDKVGFDELSEPVSLIATYGSFTTAGREISNLLSNASQPIYRFTSRNSLTPFASLTEARLAYCQYLLSRKFAPARKMRGSFDELLEFIHEEVSGVPSFLPSLAMSLKLTRRRKDSPLADVDDEDIFRRMSESP
jgi:hypothetical protein